MSDKHNIAKNTSYLTLALILQKIISFTYFTLLARFLGPADLGKYYFAFTFTTIFGIAIDLGLGNILTREVAKKQSSAEKLLGSILTLKLPLAGLTLISAFLIITFTHPDPIVRTLVYIAASAMVLDSFTSTFYATVRGFHNLKYESIASVIYQFIILAFGYSALLLGKGMFYAMGAVVLASLFNLSYSFFILVKRIRVKVRLLYDKVWLKSIIIISWPFALYAILQRIYTYLDSILLAYLAGDEQVGLYQIAFKIVFALQFLPQAFTASLYPALSSNWLNNKTQLKTSFSQAVDYLNIISWPIMTFVLLFANRIVLVFKQAYLAATLPLQIGIIAIIFIFINFPIGSLLNACDQQKRNTYNMMITTAFSVILNIILIPRYQAIGAIITVLLSNILMFSLGLLAIRKIMTYRFKANLIQLGKVILASLGMAIALQFIASKVVLLLLLPLAVLLYLALLILLRGIDLVAIRKMIKSW